MAFVIEVGPVVGGDGDTFLLRHHRIFAHELLELRVGRQRFFDPARRRNDKTGCGCAIARISVEDQRRLAESLAQHFRQANRHPRMVNMELHKDHAVGIQMAGGLAERLFRINEIVYAHVGVIGKLGV